MVVKYPPRTKALSPSLIFSYIAIGTALKNRRKHLAPPTMMMRSKRTCRRCPVAASCGRNLGRLSRPYQGKYIGRLRKTAIRAESYPTMITLTLVSRASTSLN